MTLPVAEVLRRLEGLLGVRHVPEDYVRFRIALLRSQAAALEALGAAGRGGAAAGPDAVLFDRGLLRRMLGEILTASGGDPRGGDLARLAAAAEGDAGLLEEVARAAAFGPDEARLEALAGKLGVSAEALLFTGRFLAAPFVTAAARPTAGGDAGARPAGRCPSCGSLPGLAKLRRQEGRRVLFCSLCGGDWEAGRLECPFCGEKNALERLSVGAEDPRGIEACGRCRGYLKVVDERKLPEGETVIPLVEAVATLYLDLIAEREGCRRGLPYGALS